MNKKKEGIDIEKYHWNYIEKFRKRLEKEGKEEKEIVKEVQEERGRIRDGHVERAKQGVEKWNAWAAGVKELLTKALENSLKGARLLKDDRREVELAIRNEYVIDFTVDKERNNLDVADFAYFNFPLMVNFSRVEFSGKADFSKAEFSAEADFFDVKFSGKADFSKAKFSGKADFNFATFVAVADFRGATFSAEAYFSGAEFYGEANFDIATFVAVADFSGAEFYGEATNFDDATFSGRVGFRDAIFNGVHKTISFENTQFEKQSSFTDVKFEPPKPPKDRLFRNQSLKDKALKDKGPFTIPVDFRDAYFHVVPLVDSFPSDLSQFIKANKRREKDKKQGKKDFYAISEVKFRVLKRMAEVNNNHLKATEFYACELYCQRRANNNNSKWSNYIYSWFSGYGLSFFRPFAIWWVLILSLAFAGQAGMDGKLRCSEIKRSNLERAVFYAAPSLSPIGNIYSSYQSEVRKRLYPKAKSETNSESNWDDGKLPTGVGIIRFFQSILSMTMLFFMGLALRNRFKIK